MVIPFGDNGLTEKDRALVLGTSAFSMNLLCNEVLKKRHNRL
jgi:hypothetical protein